MKRCTIWKIRGLKRNSSYSWGPGLPQREVSVHPTLVGSLSLCNGQSQKTKIVCWQHFYLKITKCRISHKTSRWLLLSPKDLFFWGKKPVNYKKSMHSMITRLCFWTSVSGHNWWYWVRCWWDFLVQSKLGKVSTRNRPVGEGEAGGESWSRLDGWREQVISQHGERLAVTARLLHSQVC